MARFVSDEPDAKERLELLCARIQIRTKQPLEVVYGQTRAFMEYFSEQIVNAVKSSQDTPAKSRVLNLKGFAHGLAGYIHPFVIRFMEEAEVEHQNEPAERFAAKLFESARTRANRIAPSLAQELLSIPMADDFENRIAELCAKRYYEFGINEIVPYPHPTLVHKA